MSVTLLCQGRFHHFHLGRELERRGLLEEIWTGYPRLKLRDEAGIPRHKIKTFPWIHAPYMAYGTMGIPGSPSITRSWEWLAKETLDRHASRKMSSDTTTVIALSGN